MSKARQEKNDLQIGDTVKTIFSGNEKFKVYDIRTVHSQREDSTIIQYKLCEFKKGKLQTSWLYREQINPFFDDKKICCEAEFIIGSRRYTKEFSGRTEDEITELINAEVKRENSNFHHLKLFKYRHPEPTV